MSRVAEAVPDAVGDLREGKVFFVFVLPVAAVGLLLSLGLVVAREGKVMARPILVAIVMSSLVYFGLSRLLQELRPDRGK